MDQKDSCCSVDCCSAALKASAVMGLAVMLLPLYLYPMATIDPIDAYPYYTGSDFLTVYLPYAVIFFISSVALWLKKSLAVWPLLISFVASHFHFAFYFGERIVFKPLFVVVFIVIPAAIFLMGAVSTLKKS
ncbi:MAG TPA: hypothetical protein VI749_08180 [Candidatus Omnitrophota bacterium]|nr:hypothetical protein [Candidatus Omnitrophota bacterium]